MSSHERAADKKCPKCKRTLTLGDFSAKAAWCKDCINAYSKEHYRRNREKILARKASYAESHSDLISERNAKSYRANAEQRRRYSRQYRETNAEVVQQKKKIYYVANREVIAEKAKRYRVTISARVIATRLKRRQENPLELARHNASRALRRAAEIRATPKWANLQEIARIYAEAQSRSVESGIKHSVDHVYPLRSKLVCGLHVAENLAVIPLRDNCSKQNRVVSDEIV